MNKLVKNIIREGIEKLQPYNSARNEDNYGTEIWLDLNEAGYAPFGYELNQKYNRYAEPQPKPLLNIFSNLYGVKKEEILMTRGGDEVIETLIKAFTTPYKSKIAITNPTFSCYKLFGEINGIEAIDIPLNKTTYLPVWDKLEKTNCNIYFLCTPSNPVGNVIELNDIKKFAKLKKNKALIVVDEAYIEFANIPSASTLFSELDNIVVLRTLSKAYALAGLRFGIALANKEVIQIMRNVLAPYPIAAPSIEIIKKSLSTLGLKYYSDKIFETIEQREYMINELKKSKLFAKVFETKTNFLFAVANDADKIYTTLKSRGIICKRKESDLKNSIRITLGNKNDNLAVLDALGIKQKFDNTRIASVTRITKETKIYIEAKLDKKGVAKIDTGIGFFDHMLDQIVKHSGISMNIQVIGDTNVDPHHTIEDTGIAIGEVIKKALGNKKGIRRYTNLELVMDEAWAKVAIDICNRSFVQWNVNIPNTFVGEFPADMVFHFFDSLAKNLGATIKVESAGENSHHIIEIIFKCFAKVLGLATDVISDQVVSTKGVI